MISPSEYSVARCSEAGFRKNRISVRRASDLKARQAEPRGEAVTKPRRVVKGQIWAVVRRTSERRGLLRPEPWVAELFEYALAIAQQRTGVKILAFEAMSNHIHLVLEDTPGRLPDFMNELDELVAKAANAEWGRRDCLWEGAGAKWTALLTPEAVEESVTYTLLNCVEAGLVPAVRSWGGFVTLPETLGTERVVARPALKYFSKRSTMPALATLRIGVPTTHARLGPEGWSRLIARRVAKGEEEARRRIGKGNFAGMARVLANSIDWRPATEEDLISPTPQAKAGAVPAAKALITAYRELFRAFLAAYDKAYRVMRRTGRALFPWGTWRWHRQCGQACADPPRVAAAAA
jgi:putative transposase